MASTLVLFTVAPIFAQTPQNPARTGVIRITVNLVQVDAVVTDSKGRQITNLKPEDFEIFEDGHPQAITNFSYIRLTAPSASETPIPPSQPGVPYIPPARLNPEQVRRTIVVVVNDLQMNFADTVYVREALKKFVEEDVQPGDLAAIVRTSSGIGVLQQLTNDKRILNAAIHRVRYYLGVGGGLEEVSHFNGRQSDQRRGSKAGFGAASGSRNFRSRIRASGALDALEYVLRGLQDLPGRKSVVFVSDGIPLPADELVWREAREVADLANRASAVLYMMDSRGLPTLEFTAEESLTRAPIRSQPGIFADTLMSRRTNYFSSQAVMSFLAYQTGGIFVHDKDDLTRGMHSVMDDLKGYYLIGYKPPANAFKKADKGGAYHRIMVRVKGRGLHVRSRMGFYGIPDEEAQPVQPSPAEQLRAAVVSPFGASAIHVEIAPQFLYRGEKEAVARLWLHVDGPDVTLVDEPDGKQKGTLEALALVFGDNGIVVGGNSGAFHASVAPGELDRFRRDGVNYHLDVPIEKPGGYQLRMAVRDPNSQKVGSANQFIEIPDLRKGRLALSGIVLNRDTLGDQGPAVRRFQAGERVNFQIEIYNGRRGKDGQQANLEGTLRILRDGQVVSTQTRGMAGAVQQGSQPLTISGDFTLSPEIPPGHYALQASVTERLAPNKDSEASQWVDFEVASP